MSHTEGSEDVQLEGWLNAQLETDNKSNTLPKWIIDNPSVRVSIVRDYFVEKERHEAIAKNRTSTSILQ
jgi:hypothetical protein